MSSHGSTSPSHPGRRHHQHQHQDDVHEAPTLDARSLAIIMEMRAMREDFHARFDAVTVRLTAVEQRHHHQPERDDPADHPIGIDPEAAGDNGRRASTAPVHPPPGRTRPSAETAWSPAALEDRFVTTTRGPTRSRPAYPPITPRPLASEIPQPPSSSPYGTMPLARYKLLPGAEQGRIKKALGRVGLSLQHILGSANTVEDDEQLDEDEDLEPDSSEQRPPPALSTPERAAHADSSESPIRVRARIEAAPSPEIPPAPNIRSGAPPVCRQEFIGDYSGDPYRLEAFFSRVGNLIRTNKDLQWLPAVMRALPIALKGNAAKWHESLSNEAAKALDSYDKWAAEMRKTFKVNKRQQASTTSGRSRSGLGSGSRAGVCLLLRQAPRSPPGLRFRPVRR